jgi:hypothetical protein
MKKIIVGGILAGLIIIVMGMVFGAISADMYKMSSKALWKPMGGDWFTQMVLFDIFTGLILAYVFSIVKSGVPASGLTKGVIFGLLAFLIGPFLGLFMTYLTMAVRTKLIIMWGLNGLFNYVLAGIIFEIIDQKIS